MSCILVIRGKKFNVDTFISKSNLRPYSVFYKGQPIFKTKPKGKKSGYNGLSIDVSKASMDDLKSQINDAIRFLKRNKEKLSHIAKTKTITSSYLSFGCNQRIGRKIAIQSDLFPNTLIKLAGEVGLGIELVIYSSSLFETDRKNNDSI